MSIGRDRKRLLADINVTPLADVIIVLLIIFMVTIPLLGGPPVLLPSARHGKARPKGAVEIVVTASGGMTLASLPVLSVADLTNALRAQAEASSVMPVRVAAARDADYATVSRVLEACRRAGIEEVGLAIQPRVGE